MSEHHFTFKGEANKPGPEWDRGYNDCIQWHDGRLIHKRILRFTDAPEYTNGWAEANITAYSELHDYLGDSLIGRDN